MPSPSRRHLLSSTSAALAGSSLLGLTGCLGTSTDGTDESRPNESATDTNESTSDDAVVLQAETDLVTSQEPIHVLSTGLRDLLVAAARSGETHRATFDRGVRSPPNPVLPAHPTVRLRGVDESVADTYDLAVEAGAHYELQLSAERVDDVPADADVTGPENLSGDQRALVHDAVRGDHPTVTPETELGSWVRHEFLDSYVRFDGNVYGGYEVQQTDSAFFSDTVWYVLSLSPASDAENPTVLDCSSIDTEVRDRLSSVVGDAGSFPKTISSPSDSMRAFAQDDPLVTTHTNVFRVTTRPEDS
ncbi:hypothetical protein [Haloarchaeobius sp. DFWS5]|uniref:hypothetical protein n=1 Tax=Haloarchaeobius sp. DFWS5 TaxID=3446114 RepID=UPI003EBAB898